MPQIYSNFAQSYLVSAIDTDDTSISVAPSTGGLFSAPVSGEFELLVLTDGYYWEVVKLTARSNDTLTVVRAHEGSAKNWAANTIIKNSVTKDTLDRFIQKDSIGAPFNIFAYRNFY